LYEPDGHNEQAVVPLSAAYVPGRQSAHAVAVVARAEGFAEPGAHATGAAAPGGQ